jgi:quercetin dioxygenase-like cupin family protein
MFRAMFFFTEGVSMKISCKGTLVVAATVMAIAGVAALAQEKKEAAGGHGIVHTAELKWTPIIKGCELASVGGDMNADGTPFVLRLRCAKGTKIPAHWHPTEENVTVLKGTFQVGMGDKFDAAGLQSMNLGDFGSIPKEMRHFAFSKTATVVQVNGMGPFKVNWVNPADVVPPTAAPSAKQ